MFCIQNSFELENCNIIKFYWEPVMIVENNDSENNTAGHHPHDEVEVGPNLEYEYLIHTNSNFIIILEENRPANVTNF